MMSTEQYINADGTTNWEKLEAGEYREYLRFERIGQTGYGAIACVNGKWEAYAHNGTSGKTQPLPSREAAAKVANNIRSNPSQFKILFDGQGI